MSMQKLGVPYVSFDGDQTDPRVFTPAQYETRVQALTEMMDEKSVIRGGIYKMRTAKEIINEFKAIS